MGDVKDRIEGLARQVADYLGVELDEVELLGQGRRTLLRITIYKHGGVSVRDCEAFSKDVGALLDVEGVIGEPYRLEVSSPGLDRPLRAERDFSRHAGELVRVTVKEKVGGKNDFVGRIEEAGPDGVVLDVEGRRFDVRYDNILRARLEIEIR